MTDRPMDRPTDQRIGRRTNIPSHRDVIAASKKGKPSHMSYEGIIEMYSQS